ncbi:lytic polysaccharide monooxygenase [Micromonospora sp. CPCC 205371]|nr:lytic polysaccharide monooxygenase [Micromonospora sp. CPCC 205371]
MSSPARKRRYALRGLVVLSTAAMLLTTALANTASAHGSVINPATRNYGCLARWGNNHMAPEMQTQDPMCWRAFQANPNAMWNWNGLYRGNVGGNHQAAVPDGTLCSGGNTEGGRYDFLDTPGPWTTTSVNNSFQVTLFDQASHGADYIWVYVTRQGFDPLTQKPRWADLERLTVVGNTPASQWQTVSTPYAGVQITMNVNAPGRTGRHMVYTIWQASHMDQPYYLCSDVRFPGGPSEPPPTSPPPNSPPATTPPPQGGACSATYSTVSQWSNGFQGEVRVTAGSSALTGWTVTLTFPNGQTVTQAWNASVTSSGSTVTARNASYNGNLGAGASTTFGFTGSGSGGAPALTRSAA